MWLLVFHSGTRDNWHSPFKRMIRVCPVWLYLYLYLVDYGPLTCHVQSCQSAHAFRIHAFIHCRTCFSLFFLFIYLFPYSFLFFLTKWSLTKWLRQPKDACRLLTSLAFTSLVRVSLPGVPSPVRWISTLGLVSTWEQRITFCLLPHKVLTMSKTNILFSSINYTTVLIKTRGHGRNTKKKENKRYATAKARKVRPILLQPRPHVSIYIL